MQSVLGKITPGSKASPVRAIVTGATGILGREIVVKLAQDPSYETIHALSRSQKDHYPPHVVHDHVDLTVNAQKMAEQLKGVEAEHVFFAAYLQQDSEEESTRVNGDMLQNFLETFVINKTVSKLKRIILVTGAKQYGVHLGQTKVPMVESDPWLPEPPNPPNFYYRQQRILHAFCEQHGVEWVVTYPNDVIGFAKGNFMNLATSIALYAAIHKELGSGELPWPGGQTFYTRFDSFTCSQLHAEFVLWAARAPTAGNQAFNVVNGDVETWANLWPRFAERFGLRVSEGGIDESLSSTLTLADSPPLALTASSAGLSKPQASKVEARVDLVQWSQRSDVKEAWTRLAQREGLEHDAFEKATWNFAKFVLGRNYDLVISMSKARKAGWSGYQDTWEAIDRVLNELEDARVVPKKK